ncbi:hypothetical protein JD292_02815 [Leucobacter sp. CSA2]|uniref:Uncharacterized protein n=1 Tax=Leucobacter edaphi TaxID=2796472 RepID=A0A934QD60_9MICO|nr:hypothetical protein [Leucobacter edaphi]MBK0421014.1 hypothetical protein [Leucobacter edaphi]
MTRGTGGKRQGVPGIPWIRVSGRLGKNAGRVPGPRRHAVILVIALLLACALVPAVPKPAAALTRGESETFPGGVWISNFLLPDGRRAYCVERDIGVPAGGLLALGEREFLPGREGLFHAFTSREGMRQINYVVDRHGQTANPWRAALVQLVVWRIRATAGGSEPLDRLLAGLRGSEKGRRLIAESDSLMARARAEATAPVPGPAHTGSLELTALDDPNQPEGQRLLTVAYPAGTTRLDAEGGVFAESGAAQILVDPTRAGTAGVRADADAQKVAVSGEWESLGAPGWSPSVHLFDTKTLEGRAGQRIVASAGSSAGLVSRGRFPAKTVALPPPFASPMARTEAQATAVIGGTMADTLHLEARPDTRIRKWPDATAEFRAYLYPEPGQPKVDAEWRPLRTGRVDPATGEPEVQRWTAPELEALPERERCMLQPVSQQTGIPIAGDGPTSSREVPVRGPGRVHWVERVLSGTAVVHEGQCGILEETTVIDRPRLKTTATPEASVGEHVYDSAHVTGPFTAQAGYLLKFEAFRFEGEPSTPGAAPNESCDASRRIYESELLPLTGAALIESPGFTVRWDHSERVAWVATLFATDERGRHVVERGRCGEQREMTTVNRPSISTTATPEVAVGDPMRDSAQLSGKFDSRGDIRWEVSFEGFRGPGALDGTTTEERRGKRDLRAACTPENRVFATEAVPVTGPGTVQSPPVIAGASAIGEVWWVETLTVIEDGVRKPVLRGTCGAPRETTRVSGISLETQADPLVSVGGGMHDTVEVSGRFSSEQNPEYELEFTGYRAEDAPDAERPPTCDASTQLFRTGRVRVRGDGSYRSPEVFASPEFGPAVHWVASLQLRGRDGAWEEVARGACGERGERTLIQRPVIRTESSGTVVAGGSLSDRAIVAGLPPRQEGVEYLVRFSAYLAGRDGELACTPEHRVAALSDEEGRPVVSGEARSAARKTSAEHIGHGGFVASLILRAHGREWTIAEGECGDPAEAFAVHARAVRLPEAGLHTPGQWTLVGAAAAVAALGGALLLGARRQRQGRASRSAAPGA